MTEERGDGDTFVGIMLPPDCGEWSGGAVNCVMLKRAERRWGDGNAIYEEAEYMAAFNAFYDVGWGAWRLLGAPRHVRLGVEVNF